MWRKTAIVGAGIVVAAIVAVVLLWPRTDAPPEPADDADTEESDIRIDFGARQPSESGADFSPTGGQMFGGLRGEFVTLASHPVLFVTGQANVAPGSEDKALQAAYTKIRNYMRAHGLVAAGPPIAITESFDYVANIWKFKAGIPLERAPTGPPAQGEGIVLGSTYSGMATRFIHVGDPNAAQPTYAKIEQWLRAKGLSAGGPSWEEYTSDPATPVSGWRTNIYVPIG